MMNEMIPFFDHRPMHESIHRDLMQAIEKVIKSYNIMLGVEVNAFEQNVCNYLHCKYAVGVNSGLDALVISLESLNIGIGDEVLVPSNTYVATWLAVTKVGAMPVAVEPSLSTYNLDPQKITDKITHKTKAIIPVHLYGLPCDMQAIINISKEYNLYIIEDNAQGFGACYHEKMTGTFGHINAHSFYPTKNLGAIGDAGIITTDDEALLHKVKISRNYGSKEKYINEVIGHNSRLDEIQAAILNVKLKHCDKWINEKRDNAARYIEGLKEVGDIILPVNNSSHTHHLFVIRTEQRDRLREYLMKKNITTLIHYPLPPHRQTIYNDIYKSTELSIADTLARTSLSLPNYIGLKTHQIDYIIDSIREYFL